MTELSDTIPASGSQTGDQFIATLREELASASTDSEVVVNRSSAPLELTPGPRLAALRSGLPAIDVRVRLGGSHGTPMAATAAAHSVHAKLTDRLWRRVPLTLGWRLQFQANLLAGERYVELARLDEGRLDALLLE